VAHRAHRWEVVADNLDDVLNVPRLEREEVKVATCGCAGAG